MSEIELLGQIVVLLTGIKVWLLLIFILVIIILGVVATR